MAVEDLTPQAAADAVEALWLRYDSLLADRSQDDWSRPTPCAGWDVADLIGHVGGLTLMFAGRPQPDPPESWTPPPGLGPIDTMTETGVAARRHRRPEAHLTELAQAREVWVEGLRGLPDLEGQTIGPTGAMSQRQFVEVRMFDLWHHLWDLHR
ncbi:MAG TPA: maleylpyruvate isomerase N-terminal domain-containing protein, partial [Euzebya sp.]|nr:maleylpyruvate isomerase N-terminal domain-containing protein [Euzebya sp.]